jgi:hypothetical protein
VSILSVVLLKKTGAGDALTVSIPGIEAENSGAEWAIEAAHIARLQVKKMTATVDLLARRD